MGPRKAGHCARAGEERMMRIRKKGIKFFGPELGGGCEMTYAAGDENFTFTDDGLSPGGGGSCECADRG